MNLESLAKQLSQQSKRPPVEQWDPPFCGDMDIEVKADGSWYYMGTPIGRKPLVKLFASVLTIRDGNYYLITPVEKVGIRVVDAPFVVTSWRQQDTEQGQAIIFTTNVDDEFILNADNPLQLPQGKQSAPLYLDVHRSMQASVHRNVYYQLAEIAEAKKGCWTISSCNLAYSIGEE